MEEKRFKVLELLALQEGVGEHGEWKSREAIVEEAACVQYPDRYLVTFRGEKVDLLNGVNVGDTVKLAWSAYVRKFTTKNGTEVRQQQLNVWKLENVTTF